VALAVLFAGGVVGGMLSDRVQGGTVAWAQGNEQPTQIDSLVVKRLLVLDSLLVKDDEASVLMGPGRVDFTGEGRLTMSGEDGTLRACLSVLPEGVAFSLRDRDGQGRVLASTLDKFGGAPDLTLYDATGRETWSATSASSAGLPALPLGVGAGDARGTYAGVGEGHWVRKKLDGGQMVVLEDGSLWGVNPLNRIDTMLWLPVQKITVLEGDNPLYPYKLVNADAGDVVEAEYLGKQ
jgi:hypothetical protein